MLLSSSNRKYRPFQFLSYFSVVVCLRCFVTTNDVTYSIYIPGKSGIWCHYYCAVYDECKWSDTFWLENRIRAKLPEDIGPIKCMSDNFCRVCKINHILSVIHHTICGDVCFQFSHFPCDYWENIYIYIYIGRMNYYPLFRVRLWNNGMRCMSFYILTKKIDQ